MANQKDEIQLKLTIDGNWKEYKRHVIDQVWPLERQESETMSLLKSTFVVGAVSAMTIVTAKFSDVSGELFREAQNYKEALEQETTERNGSKKSDPPFFTPGTESNN